MSYKIDMPAIDYRFSKNDDGLPTINDLLQLKDIYSRLNKDHKFNKKDLTSISNAVILLVLAEDYRKT